MWSVILLRKWKLVPGRYEKKQRMGDEIIEKTLQGQKDGGRDSARILHESCQHNKDHMEK